MIIQVNKRFKIRYNFIFLEKCIKYINKSLEKCGGIYDI